MDINELLEQGRADLATTRAARERAEQERERAARAKWEAAWAEVDAKIKAILPEALHPYITQIGERKSEHGNLNMPDRDYSINVLLAVPGCIEIKAMTWVKSDQRETTYTVPAVDLDTDYAYDGQQVRRILVHWTSSYGAYESSDLPLVLALAEERGARRAELQAELDAWRAEREMERQAESEHRVEQANAENAERAVMLRFLDRDPVAVHLLRVFAAIQGEREHWQDQLEQAGEHLADFDDRVSKRIQTMQQAIDDAQNRASDADYRARQAEDDLESLKRKQRRG